MSGVRTGTRLEHLEQLQRRLKHEIEVERRRLAIEGPAPRRPQIRANRPETAGGRVKLLLAELRATPHDVKVWAVSVGLVDEVKRGRVAEALVEAYADAHQRQDVPA